MEEKTSNTKNINLKKYLGYKFYKEKEDGSFDIKRIIRISDSKNNIVKVLNEDNSTTRISYNELKEYTPLEPYGLMMFNIVDMGSKNNKTQDVIIATYKTFDIKLNVASEPFIICRQSIVDFFNDLNCQNPEDNDLVGISITRDNCPTQIKFIDLMTCTDIDYSLGIFVYRDDNIESILKCIPNKKFNSIFYDMYYEHCKSTNPAAMFSKTDKGWCKDIATFLEINNFMDDFNAMCNMTGVDFDLSKYLISKENSEYYSLNEEALLFFNLTFKVNVVDTRVIKYDYSINLGDFNNNNYTLLRDNKNNIYIVVYLVNGEYLEEELRKKAEELSLSQKLRLSFYNKYKDFTK